MDGIRTLGIYLHIPFCVRKCTYCDFLSSGDADGAAIRQYLDALAGEISWYARGLGSAGGRRIDPAEYTIDSVYVGGGTPSLIEAADLASLLDAIHGGFGLAPDAEISFEANPGTVSLQGLSACRRAGFNRLSIGAQSFDDSILRFLGRIHRAADARSAFKTARDAGFDNISLDLMFGIPGQTMESWIETIMAALALEPEHLSFYGLKIEEGTQLDTLIRSGAVHEMDDALDRQMYAEILKILSGTLGKGDGQGYGRYEISNAAKAGFSCRHNLKYWSMEDYLGFGLGAHSYMNGERFSNQTDMERYRKAQGSRVAWRHLNTREDEISEYLFTGLRKTQGIQTAEYEARFGEPVTARFGEEIGRLSAKGLLFVSEGRIALTDPGIDISNHVLSHFV